MRGDHIRGAFAQSLAGRIRGEVADDGGTLAAFSADASNHRVVPLCVAFPRTADDVVAIVDACRAEGVPITSRGAGTNLAGSAVGAGVVVDYSRHLNAIVAVDPEARTATVEPGVVLDDLQARLRPHRLRFGPDPATHDRCTVGGMLGTNSCGARALAWGTTSENTRALDVVLADGATVSLDDSAPAALRSRVDGVLDRWREPIAAELGRFSRQVSGYGLHYLLDANGASLARAFVGSEGTCGLVVSATLDLVRVPHDRALVVAGFESAVAAALAAPALAKTGALTVEFMEAELVDAYDHLPGPPRSRPALPRGDAWLLLEVGGDEEQCGQLLRSVGRTAQEGGAIEVATVTDPGEQREYWTIREKGAGLSTRLPRGGEYWPGWEDAAVPVDRLASYLTDFTELLQDCGRHGDLYGHFGEGCVHVRIDHDLLSAVGRAEYRRFQEAAAELVVAHGGSLSGEHGDGRQRSELLGRMYSADVLSAFAGFKAAFDPDNLLNPGLIVDPLPLDRDLRLARSRPHATGLAFTYEADDGDFGKALRRCVGVGSCRSAAGGMCPSFQATKDERHSTRGRARILFEMLDGSLAPDAWQSDDAAAALDLCLMCKACSSECPVSVDMATYKAEFLYQRYRRRLRPRSHYSLGWLPLWLGAVRRMPRLSNSLTSRPTSSRLVKRLGGIDSGRDLPQVSDMPGRSSALPGRGPAERATAARDEVVLWLDTFTRTFAPDVADAAAEVLRRAGLAARPLGPGLCCALTWMSTGQLGVARRVVARTVRRLDATGDSCPIVVLEPSCASALRDDAVALLDSGAARRVARRVVGLAQILADRPPLAVVDAHSGPSSSIIAQFHCHQRATAGTAADRRLLARLGYDVTSVEEGCCGLAGNFGFEAGHLDVSRTCAAQSFLPYLERDSDAPVLADGFSCRLQMQQLAGEALGRRRPLHLAQFLREVTR